MNQPNDKIGIKQAVTLYSKGFCMGIADLIPGISGGTIALIVGIYERLIDAIKSFDIAFLKLIIKLKIRDALKSVDWKFLACVLAGILTAILLLSKVMKWLLVNEPILLHAFFFGLILSSIPLVARLIKNWSPRYISIAALSAVVMYFFVGLVPVNTPNALWFVLLSGALAICAMILPGISGSFILLLIGKYTFVINAIHDMNFVILLTFVFGCLLGLLSFVRVISWLLHHHHDVTMTILIGLVIGSLRKIWPWKETLESMVDHHGKTVPLVQINILPQNMNSEIISACLLIIAGCFVVCGLDKLSKIK